MGTGEEKKVVTNEFEDIKNILDPFNVTWTIMTRIEDLSEEESSRRVREWADSFNKAEK